MNGGPHDYLGQELKQIQKLLLRLSKRKEAADVLLLIGRQVVEQCPLSIASFFKWSEVEFAGTNTRVIQVEEDEGELIFQFFNNDLNTNNSLQIPPGGKEFSYSFREVISDPLNDKVELHGLFLVIGEMNSLLVTRVCELVKQKGGECETVEGAVELADTFNMEKGAEVRGLFFFDNAPPKSAQTCKWLETLLLKFQIEYFTVFIGPTADGCIEMFARRAELECLVKRRLGQGLSAQLCILPSSLFSPDSVQDIPFDFLFSKSLQTVRLSERVNKQHRRENSYMIGESAKTVNQSGIGAPACFEAGEDLSRKIRNLLLESVSEIIEQDAEYIEETEVFLDLGMDSLMTAQLQSVIEVKLGHDWKISPRAAFDYPSVALLRNYLESIK